MNKHLFFGILAAAGLLLAACSQENLNPQTGEGGEAVVSFTIGLENSVQTRAISDGTSVNKLIYALFNADGARVEGMAKDSIETSFPATVSLTLAKNQTYEVVFWAQNKDCEAYKIDDDMNVTVDYTSTDDLTYYNNDETRDAFYGTSGKFSISGSGSKSVTLTRPFAQINVGVTQDDWDAASKLGIDIENSSVTIQNAGTEINLLTGKVSGTATEVSYALDTIPALKKNPGDLTVDGTTYKWLSMSYILVADGSEDGTDKTTLESLSYTFQPESGTEITFSNGLTSVPVQRNYRTNIIGQILTGDLQFEIVIDKNYDGDHPVEEWDGSSVTAVTADANGVYNITTASELAWVAQQVNNGELEAGTTSAASMTKAGDYFSDYTVKLQNDIYLNNQPWPGIGTVPEGELINNHSTYLKYAFHGTFDGNGHTIYNLNVSSNSATGLFSSLAGTVKNLTVDGATVTSNHWAGVICGYSSDSNVKIDSCHVKNATVTVTVEESGDTYDNGDKAGGIIGFMYYGTAAGGSVTNCSVENTTITAFRDLGGIAGRSNGTVANNTIGDNVTLTRDLRTGYGDYDDETCYVGDYVGRDGNSDATTGNTGTPETITLRAASCSSSDEIQAAITEASGDPLYITLESDIECSSALTFTGDVSIDGQGEATVSGAPIYFRGENTVIKGVTFNNGTSGTESAMYFTTVGTKTITIEDCTFIDAEWDAIQATRVRESVVIRNCTFHNVQTGKGYRYIHLEIRDDENGSYYATTDATVEITGCTFINVSSDYCLDSAITIYGFFFDNMTIENNIVKGDGADNLTTSIMWISNGLSWTDLMTVDQLNAAFVYSAE